VTVRPWAATCLAAMLALAPIPSAFAQVATPSVDPQADRLARALETHVDPRLELAAAVLDLTPWAKEFAQLPASAYAKDAATAFAKFANHSAVKTLNTFLESDEGSLESYFQVALTLSTGLDDFGLPNDRLVERMGGAAGVQTLQAELKQFAADSSFLTFYQAHAAFYAGLEQRVYKALAPDNPIVRLETYYGSTNTRYQILLAALAPKDNSPQTLTSLVTKEGPIAVVRPEATTKDKLPDFRPEAPAFVRGIDHAWGRAFIEPVTERHDKDLLVSANLYKPITVDMKEQHHPNWSDCFTEHLLRAVDARILQADGEGKQAQISLRSNERAGYAYVRDVFDQLAKYEDDRKDYPSLEAFMPTLLARLSYLTDAGVDEDVAKRTASFQGPLMRALDKRYLANVVLVRPTPVDPKMKAGAEAYVKRLKDEFRKRYHKDVKIVTGEEAALIDRKSTAFLIVGTPWSNPFLAALIKFIPLKVSKDAIYLGEKQFIGKDLRLLTTFSNPYNGTLPMEILTSTDDRDIEGIFSLPIGPTDFIVYHGDRPIAEGDFVYDLKGRWTLH